MELRDSLHQQSKEKLVVLPKCCDPLVRHWTQKKGNGRQENEKTDSAQGPLGPVMTVKMYQGSRTLDLSNC